VADRIKQLEAILQSEPGDTFCLYGLAMEHAKAGRHEAAIEWFDRTLAVDPDYCYAYFHKAKSQEELGDLRTAIETLQAGLKRARAKGDGKAAGEIEAYLDELG
jgi:tetratricopeptide (TPR) repeat protein